MVPSENANPNESGPLKSCGGCVEDVSRAGPVDADGGEGIGPRAPWAGGVAAEKTRGYGP